MIFRFLLFTSLIDFSTSALFLTMSMFSCPRKESIPGLPVAKVAPKPHQELGFFLDSWQCGSLPASGWSGTENRRTVPRNLWGGGLWGHPCISDLKICRNEMQLPRKLPSGNQPCLKVKWGTQLRDHLFVHVFEFHLPIYHIEVFNTYQNWDWGWVIHNKYDNVQIAVDF